MKRGELTKKLMQEIRDEILEDYFQVCVYALNCIFWNNPVWTGAYVKSHRVTFAGQFTEPPVSRGPATFLWMGMMGPVRGQRQMMPPPAAGMSQSIIAAAYQKQYNKLVKMFQTHRNMKKLRQVIFLNEAEDAALVEFEGTPTGVKHVYLRSSNQVRALKGSSNSVIKNMTNLFQGSGSDQAGFESKDADR